MSGTTKATSVSSVAMLIYRPRKKKKKKKGKKEKKRKDSKQNKTREGLAVVVIDFALRTHLAAHKPLFFPFVVVPTLIYIRSYLHQNVRTVVDLILTPQN